MNKMFEDLKTKVVTNKELLIKIGCGVAGALIGAAVTAVILNSQTGSFVPDLDELAEKYQTTEVSN